MIIFIFVNIFILYYLILLYNCWILFMTIWCIHWASHPVRLSCRSSRRAASHAEPTWWTRHGMNAMAMVATDGHRWWNIRWLHPCSPVNIYIKLWKSMDFPYRWWIFYLSLLEGKMYDELYTDDFQDSPKVGNTFLKMGFYAREIKG